MPSYGRAYTRYAKVVHAYTSAITVITEKLLVSQSCFHFETANSKEACIRVIFSHPTNVKPCRIKFFSWDSIKYSINNFGTALSAFDFLYTGIEIIRRNEKSASNCAQVLAFFVGK
jgi:hypothetical protein